MYRRTLRKGTFCVLSETSSIFQGNSGTHSKNLTHELTSLCHFVLWLVCMAVRGGRKEDDGCCHSGIKSMFSDIYLTGHRGDYKQLGFLFTEGGLGLKYNQLHPFLTYCLYMSLSGAPHFRSHILYP